MSIAEIKAQLTISQVLDHYGLKPDHNRMLCCPFHADKTPSMQVYIESNTVFCFSSNCKLHGKAIDQIDFILHKENLTRHHAILKAGQLCGSPSPVTPPVANAQSEPMQAETLQDVFRNLQRSLYVGDNGKIYAKSRGLYEGKLEMGYNALSKVNGKKTYLYEHLKACLVFPLKDKEGNIVSLYGRSVSNVDQAKHYYLRNRSGLYPCWPTPEATRLILTEGIIDAATVLTHAAPDSDYQVLACYGTNGFTIEHEQAVKALSQLQEIIIFFDGDDAGREGTKRLVEKLKTIVTCTLSSVNCPEGEDANSIIQSHEPGVLNHLIGTRQILFSTEKPVDVMVAAREQLNTSNPDYLTYVFENLQLHVIGGVALYPLDKLKITLKIERNDSPNPLHSIRQSNLDMYSDDQLQKFIRSVSERLEVGSKPVQLAIAHLLGELESHRQSKIEQQQPKPKEKRIINGQRKNKALKFLQSENLLQATHEQIARSGVVGEEINRLLMYLVFTSRKREQPLHIISLGASGTGKTYLQEKISELIPEEDKLEITTLSENALYYFERKELQHKLVLIEDLDGAQDDKILYAIRELMSKKRISKTVPIKDSKGNLKTITITVEGPISLAGTTTKEKLYEDNANRSLLIYLDNSQEHRTHIMEYQRKLSAGQINKQQEAQARELLQDVQSILKPIKVVNPYATQLCIPETVFKPLRTNVHYLAFIETITFYHQYQREIKTDSATGEQCIETTLEDIGAANKLLKDVLLAKSDELTNACRFFLENIKEKLQQEKRQSFYSYQVREWMRINPHNLRHYIYQLLQYGYIRIIGGNRFKQGYEYELTSREEYVQLNDQITNALEKTLQAIKAKNRKPGC